ncbi:MAG: arylamine N-acetyltransferase [Acidobacteriota bacterium]|nr:arylamine N-acetyltransferase [Acidobacteriota bacterium]
MFDLDAYLERIGLRSGATLAEIHRAHVTAIPFENLDPHRGIPVSLDLEDLQRKMVGERRGGYCFEQNSLLAGALEALGATVEPMLARVRVGVPAGTVRPRGHMVLRVEHEGATWHADAGFGLGTPLEPIPFGPGGVHEQAGWRFRVVRDVDELVLQCAGDPGAGDGGARDGAIEGTIGAQADGGAGEWRDIYAFSPKPVPPIDLTVSNWFTSTHPASAFVTGLIVGTQSTDGGRAMLSDWGGLSLIEETPAERTVTALEREAIPDLLEGRFGLPGFVLDGDGRVASATPRG